MISVTLFPSASLTLILTFFLFLPFPPFCTILQSLFYFTSSWIISSSSNLLDETKKTDDDDGDDEEESAENWVSHIYFYVLLFQICRCRISRHLFSPPVFSISMGAETNGSIIVFVLRSSSWFSSSLCFIVPSWFDSTSQCLAVIPSMDEIDLKTMDHQQFR